MNTLFFVFCIVAVVVVADTVQKTMDRLFEITGRRYNLFDYYGDPEAERVMIIMGSGADVARETVEVLQAAGEKVGMIQVHLYRPFSAKHFVAALPNTTKTIGVLDRTKEPGAIGEPLYIDVRTAIGEGMHEKWMKCKDYPVVVGGRSRRRQDGGFR